MDQIWKKAKQWEGWNRKNRNIKFEVSNNRSNSPPCV